MLSKDCRYCGIIPDNPKYCISRDAQVFDVETSKRVYQTSDLGIMLDGKPYRITDLLVHTFIGVLPYPITLSGMKVDPYFHRIPEALKYAYDVKGQFIQDTKNPDVYWLGDIEFRYIPGSKYRCIISRNGVCYDLSQERFVYLNWTYGYANLRFSWAPTTEHENCTNTVLGYIYRAYRGVIPPSMQVDHVDDCRWHNTLDNAQLLSPVENTRKSRLYDDDKVRVVCQMIEDDEPVEEIMRAIGLDLNDKRARKNTISFISSLAFEDDCYRDLKKEYSMSNYSHTHNRVYTGEEMLNKICQMVSDRCKFDDIIDECGYDHTNQEDRRKIYQTIYRLAIEPTTFSDYKAKYPGMAGYVITPDEDSAHPRSKLEKVCEMILEKAKGEQIAEALGFDYSDPIGKRDTAAMVYNLCRNPKTYMDLKKKYPGILGYTISEHPELTPDKVREIRRRLADGERGCDLADEFGISRATVSNIKKNRAFTNIV